MKNQTCKTCKYQNNGKCLRFPPVNVNQHFHFPSVGRIKYKYQDLKSGKIKQYINGYEWCQACGEYKKGK